MVDPALSFNKFTVPLALVPSILNSVVQLPLMKTISFKVTWDTATKVAFKLLASSLKPLPSIVIVLLM